MKFDPGLGRRFKSVRGHLPTSPRGNRSVLGPVHPQWQVHPLLRPGLDGKVVGTLDRSMSSGVHGCRSNWEAGMISIRKLSYEVGVNCLILQEHRAQAVFNHSEDFVMFPDEATTSLCCWDSRNASRKQLLSLGHNGVVRHIVHSPSTPAFLTCSDDFRARFWYKRNA